MTMEITRFEEVGIEHALNMLAHASGALRRLPAYKAHRIAIAAIREAETALRQRLYQRGEGATQ